MLSWKLHEENKTWKKNQSTRMASVAIDCCPLLPVREIPTIDIHRNYRYLIQYGSHSTSFSHPNSIQLRSDFRRLRVKRKVTDSSTKFFFENFNSAIKHWYKTQSNPDRVQLDKSTNYFNRPEFNSIMLQFSWFTHQNEGNRLFNKVLFQKFQFSN